ncbi:hypothetical protein AVEN_76687-1 [Araneus ventricosus]|uniref:Uncharacterized protein n=1 Tax=Araneus ventricosus TaxID=182803 RepID=A0A4Y2BP07_ARAVE|nr:hypothetical protein AVEN_76687-1 [Araneus ventricosus]
MSLKFFPSDFPLPKTNQKIKVPIIPRAETKFPATKDSPYNFRLPAPDGLGHLAHHLILLTALSLLQRNALCPRHVIEPIWVALQCAVQKKSPPPGTPMDLRTALQDSWCEKPPEYLQT